MKNEYATVQWGMALRSWLTSLLLIASFQIQAQVAGDTFFTTSITANRVGCPTLTTPVNALSICANATAPSLPLVSTNTTSTDSLRLVYFTSPQSGTAMYSGGTPLGTYALTNPLASTVTASLASLPNATGTAVVYYVYGLLAPTPSDPACRVSAQTTVTVFPGVSMALTPRSTTLTCTNPYAALSLTNPTPGASYSWWRSGSPTPTSGTSITVSQPGTYTLTGRLGNCWGTATTATVSSDQRPGTVSVNQGALSCSTPTITLTATITGRYSSVLWTGPWGMAGEGNTLSVSAPGIYRAIVTFANGCVDASNPARVSQSPVPPPLIAAQGGAMACKTCSVMLSVETDATVPLFIWTGPDGFSSTDPFPIVSKEGSYTIVVKDLETGCEAYDIVVVEAPTNDPCPQPFLDTPDALTLCAGELLPDVRVLLNQVNPGDQVAFVLFDTPQSSSSAYTGGTTLATVTPEVDLVATLPGSTLPPVQNRSPVEQTRYLYALLIPQPGLVDGCTPALVTITIGPGGCMPLSFRRIK
ncbi:hypothetical protein FAES_1153 [Fibrella aestuarina BUZ 2]|uniref:Ig-like domain-containing protein n=1 Tax=Fibrella aestuarina BUZ 2 TaxID=1166018 RepID=I0K4W0_9BACT|nr:hypothetical protein [Fibrella aestuarina]CCG99163.1 hypothetical protein FAES_1153 [Fibrella aestuarina BUZ 2]